MNTEMGILEPNQLQHVTVSQITDRSMHLQLPKALAFRYAITEGFVAYK